LFDECKLNREKFDAPAIVVAYNLFMNAVDRMDQRRQPVACQRREKRVSMTIFTLILDLACSNGYAVGCTLSTQYKRSVRFDEFKRRTAEQLTRPWREERSKKASIKKRKRQDQESPSMPPASLQSHVLSDNAERNDGTKSAHERV